MYEGKQKREAEQKRATGKKKTWSTARKERYIDVLVMIVNDCNGSNKYS